MTTVPWRFGRRASSSDRALSERTAQKRVGDGRSEDADDWAAYFYFSFLQAYAS